MFVVDLLWFCVEVPFPFFLVGEATGIETMTLKKSLLHPNLTEVSMQASCANVDMDDESNVTLNEDDRRRREGGERITA